MGAAASAAGAENGGTPTSKLQLYRSLKKELMAINESQSSDPAMQVSGGEEGAFCLLFSGGEPRLEDCFLAKTILCSETTYYYL